jgi:hypothetical protein
MSLRAAAGLSSLWVVDPLYAHVFLNHIPVVGGIGALLLLAWGVYRRSRDVTIAALVAFVVVGIAGMVAFATGSRAAAAVGDAASAALMQQHRDAAIAALFGLGAASMVAASALFVWLTTKRYPMYAAVATLLIGLAASILVVRAATLGGRLSHSELRGGAFAKR